MNSFSAQTPIRVVLADDHSVVRAGIRAFLESSGGITVEAEAGDGRQAVQLAADLKPDVVVLDIQMPVMNGIEATRAIRAQGLPVGILILTAYDDPPYIQALLKAGANGYLLKTAPPDEIIAAVVEVNQGRQVIDRLLSSSIEVVEQSVETQLSERELDVVRQVAAGLTNKAIASRLQISPKTVQNHLSNIFTKLNCESRTEMVTMAIRFGWLKPSASPLTSPPEDL
jgi:DNA-binding NarL/FixJ family response regulator